MWPIYQYVEARLAYEGLNALAILGSFPTVGGPGVLRSYGPVWYQQEGNVAPPPESPVKLTIAGLQHVPDGPDAIRTFLKVLRSMVACLRATRFSPTTLVEAVITRDEIAKVDHLLEAETAMSQLRQLLEHEPAVPRPTSVEGNWQIKLHPELRRYDFVRDATDYLDRVAAFLMPAAELPPPMYPSPLTLPDALGYLDAVWHLHFQEALIKLPGATQTARLAVDVGSVEEFQAAMSALGEILADLQAPGPSRREHALERLRTKLKAELANGNVDRIDHAIDTLEAVRKIRNGIQHAGATRKAVSGLAFLRIPYPITDWAAAWNQIRAHATQAFDAIRDELQARGSAD